MFNFIRFAQDLRVAYLTSGHHHCHAGWAQTHCPQCTDGRHGYHLGFSLEGGNFSCWRCGPVRVVDAVRGLAKVSPEKAYDLIREYQDARRGPRREERARVRQCPPPRALEACSPLHLRYLASRGLTRVNRVVRTWDLKGTRSLSGPLWSWRVVGPIKNAKGDVVAYVGRSIKADVKRKYMVTEDASCTVDPRTLLYGIEKVVGSTVLVVEGPGDAWNLGPGAVATLGIDWKPEQANQLRRFTRRFLMYDPEPKAQRRAQELAEWLSLYPGETEVIEGLPSDPGSLGEKLVRRVRRTLLGGDGT